MVVVVTFPFSIFGWIIKLANYQKRRRRVRKKKKRRKGGKDEGKIERVEYLFLFGIEHLNGKSGERGRRLGERQGAWGGVREEMRGRRGVLGAGRGVIEREGRRLLGTRRGLRENTRRGLGERRRLAAGRGVGGFGRRLWHIGL